MADDVSKTRLGQFLAAHYSGQAIYRDGYQLHVHFNGQTQVLSQQGPYWEAILAGFVLLVNRESELKDSREGHLVDDLEVFVSEYVQSVFLFSGWNGPGQAIEVFESLMGQEGNTLTLLGLWLGHPVPLVSLVGTGVEAIDQAWADLITKAREINPELMINPLGGDNDDT